MFSLSRFTNNVSSKDMCLCLDAMASTGQAALKQKTCFEDINVDVENSFFLADCGTIFFFNIYENLCFLLSSYVLLILSLSSVSGF